MKRNLLCLICIAFFSACTSQDSIDKDSKQDLFWDGSIVRFGTMHEVIGEQKHNGKVELGDVNKDKHLFAVGALAGLAGETTVVDGVIVASKVDSDGEIFAVDSAENQEAALLIGAHVPQWIEFKVESSIPTNQFESFIEEMAAKNGMNPNKPFPFVIKGRLINLKMHVINGECPVHTKRNGFDHSSSCKPYKMKYKTTDGNLIGIFAKNMEGKITHKGSATHTHVVLLLKKTGPKITGHVEETGVGKGAILRLPKIPICVKTGVKT